MNNKERGLQMMTRLHRTRKGTLERQYTSLGEFTHYLTCGQLTQSREVTDSDECYTTTLVSRLKGGIEVKVSLVYKTSTNRTIMNLTIDNGKAGEMYIIYLDKEIDGVSVKWQVFRKMLSTLQSLNGKDFNIKDYAIGKSRDMKQEVKMFSRLTSVIDYSKMELKGDLNDVLAFYMATKDTETSKLTGISGEQKNDGTLEILAIRGKHLTDDALLEPYVGEDALQRLIYDYKAALESNGY